MPQRTAPHDTQAPELETPRRAAASHASVGADGIPIEAILMTASGCGVMVKDHGHLLAHDSAYATKAARISALTLDLSEALARFEPELSARLIKREGPRVAYHPPCTLQDGQQIRGQVERLLGLAGVDVTLCQDSHLCCGSAGTSRFCSPSCRPRCATASWLTLRLPARRR